MKKADNNDIPAILEYLNRDVANCLYMYIDIRCYGAEHVDVWYEKKNDEFILIAMKYHGSFQVYSDRPQEADLEGVVELLKDYRPAMINARAELIERLKPYFEEDYLTDGGFILRLKKFVSIEDDEFVVEVADKSDVDELSRLISEDPYYSDAYTFDEIKGQLIDRMDTGMGVSFIIRKDGNIIAHNSITAQVDDICIAGMLLIHKDWRQSNAALVIEKFIIDYVNNQGKKLFGFSNEPRRRKQFKYGQ
ncbi:MAG: hypothetical protein ACSW8G_00070 [Bacillota bacterium]